MSVYYLKSIVWKKSENQTAQTDPWSKLMYDCETSAVNDGSLTKETEQSCLQLHFPPPKCVVHLYVFPASGGTYKIYLQPLQGRGIFMKFYFISEIHSESLTLPAERWTPLKKYFFCYSRFTLNIIFTQEFTEWNWCLSNTFRKLFISLHSVVSTWYLCRASVLRVKALSF